METETFIPTPPQSSVPQAPGPQFAAPQPPGPQAATPPRSPGGADGDPPDGPDLPAPGRGPSSDPTRSGAVWVGGAGVAMLLAAAAVLTAVRWDDIGQSMKLGGLVAITTALLAAGERFRDTIPMTARAMFHLGALLIPFDMAAVAILAGRSWQETLLLTSVTSVSAWYGIGRARPSGLLRIAAGVGVVGVAAGVAAVSGLALPLVLGVAAIIGVAINKPFEGAAWAVAAGVLPVGAVLPWPTRIAGAMTELGFDVLYREQLLAAGAVSVLCLVAVTKLLPRPEIAWAAVAVAGSTALLGFAQFAQVGGAYLWVALGFLAAELLALALTGDPLWTPVLKVVSLGAEIVAGATSAFVVVAAMFEFVSPGTTVAVAAGFAAVAWLIADYRRLKEPTDWLTGLVCGSGWPVTTVLFPASILAAFLGFEASALLIALASVALAYWMVATWRPGGAYGAIVLVGVAAASAASTGPWTELTVGALGAIALMVGAQLRLRARDSVAALATSLVAVAVWLVSSLDAVASEPTHWPLAIVLAGAWLLSWLAEAGSGAPGTRSQPDVATVAMYAAQSMGRLGAVAVLISSLWSEPVVAAGLCALVIGLAMVDYLQASRRGAASGTTALVAPVLVMGAALGLAGIPIASIVGLTAATSGAALAIAGFVLVGLALVAPRDLDLGLGVTAGVVTLLGLTRAFDDPAMMAVAVIAAGCSALFASIALRDMVIAVGGYVTVGLGVSLQLAVWDVTWLEPYLVMPAIAALILGQYAHRSGASSWAAFAPTIAVLSYVSIAERFSGGPAWHSVIAGAVAVAAIVFGGYRKLAGPLITGSVVLAVAAGYECLGPASLVPTWAWLAAGGSILLAAGVALERSDTTPLERGQQLRSVIATQYT